jgi:TetR/AcrR family transcriptional regulator, lmrAB and yxaGH operons repressor
MQAQGSVRTNMVQGAVRLLATRGVEGTSFSQVLSVAGAPRGSVYHHFPGGKSELLHAALDLASGRALEQMESLRGESAREVLDGFLAQWQALLDYSSLRAGCAVASVALAGAEDDVLEHAGSVFRAWTEQLADLFTAGGLAGDAARQFATLTIAATEGAVLLARAERDRRPFDDVGGSLREMLRSKSE